MAGRKCADRGRGAVAAGHRVTADAAVEILRAGGNAFDAAVAAAWAACVCEPVLAAPAGGGFLMAHDGEDAALFDFFCDTPRSKKPVEEIEFVEIFADFGTLKQPFHIGAGATATPGFIPGLFAVNRQLGSLPMADLIEPAVRAANEGVAVSAFQAQLFEVVEPILTWTPQARALFAPKGALLKRGERFLNPRLAQTIQSAVRGQLAGLDADIVAESANCGGHLTADDVANYKAVRRQPIHLRMADTDIYLNPPPSMGGLMVGCMLSHWHAAARSLGDGPLVRARAMSAVDAAWRELGPALGDRFGLPPVVAPAAVVSRGTTHISVIDAEGCAAAVTISNGEGNGRILHGHGFMLNNMLGEENLNPDGFHCWQPGMRLSSMMAPTILHRPDGSAVAFGSGGANRIRTAIFQAAASVLVGDLPPDAIVEAPRLHFENGVLDIELAGEGHGIWADLDGLLAAWPEAVRWPERSLYFGGVHMVTRDPGGVYGGAGDPRRSGVYRIA